MSGRIVPTLVLALTICAYWGYVAWMVARVSSRAGGVGRLLVPARRSERLSWIVWGRSLAAGSCRGSDWPVTQPGLTLRVGSG